MRKVMKKSGAVVALAMLSLAMLIKPACAERGASAQGAICGPGSTSEIVIDSEPSWSLNRQGAMWKGTNAGPDDKCGLVLIGGPEKHVLRLDKSQELLFHKLDEADRAKVFVTFVFRPHPDQNTNLVTVQKPLTDFKFGMWRNHVTASIPTTEIWSKQPGNCDLQKIIITLKGKAQVIFRAVDLETQDYWWTPDVNLTVGDCKLLD